MNAAEVTGIQGDMNRDSTRMYIYVFIIHGQCASST